jgi:hypothetical protein
MQVALQADRLRPAKFRDISPVGWLPSGRGPSLRTYVLAGHPNTHPTDRRSACLRPGTRFHAARGRPRDPRPRRRAYAAPRILSTCDGPTGRRSPAGTPQTQGTPRSWRSGRSTARRVPGHRRGMRVGRVVWRHLRHRRARPAGAGRSHSGTSAQDGARPASELPAQGVAAAVPASLHLTRGSTASLPAGCDRAGRTRLRAGRLGHIRWEVRPGMGRTTA